jgi:nitroreductase
MNVIEAIRTRRSIRKYKPSLIPNTDLKKILEAARLAPSAGNKQPWRFIVVRDPESRKKLAIAAQNQSWAANAGAFIVALGVDKKTPGIYERWVERDVMTAVEHMVLVAWELGYGTCWIGAFEDDKVRELLDIPKEMIIINLLSIGVPDHVPNAKTRKPIEELFSAEEYGKPLKL